MSAASSVEVRIILRALWWQYIRIIIR